MRDGWGMLNQKDGTTYAGQWVSGSGDIQKAKWRFLRSSRSMYVISVGAICSMPLSDARFQHLRSSSLM